MSGIFPPRARRRKRESAPSTDRRTGIREKFCSAWQPSSNGILVAASTASIAACGAFIPRCFLRTARALPRRRRLVRRGFQLCCSLTRLGDWLFGDSRERTPRLRREVSVDKLSMSPSRQRRGRTPARPRHTSPLPWRRREPRQTLRSRRPGNNSQLHFRLADLRGRRCDPVVAGHGRSSPPPNAVP